MTPERMGFFVGLALGGLIVIGGGLATFFVVAKLLKKRVEAKIAADPAGAARPAGEMIPLFYILSFMFWPAAFIVGAQLLKETHTARAGRMCILIGIGFITFIATLTSVGMVVAAVAFGDQLPM